MKVVPITLVALLILSGAGMQVSAYTHKLTPSERLDALDKAIDSYKLNVRNLFTAVTSGTSKDVSDAQGQVLDSGTEVEHINRFIKHSAKQSKTEDKELFSAYMKLIKRIKVLNNAELCMSRVALVAANDSEQMLKFVACSSMFLNAYTNVKTGIKELHELLQSKASPS